MEAFLRELTSADNLPLLLAFVALSGFILGLGVGVRGQRSRRPAWRKAPWRKGMKRTSPSPMPVRNGQIDPVSQLNNVMNAEFRPKRLMSKSEARTFLQIERLLRAQATGWRVMAQVSLSEVLTCA